MEPLVLAGLVLAVVSQIIARGRSLSDWAIILICVSLLGLAPF